MKKNKFFAICLCLVILLFSTACKSNITNTPLDDSSLSHSSEQLNSNAENNQNLDGQNTVNDKNPSSNAQASQGFELEEDVFDGENSAVDLPSNNTLSSTSSDTLEQSGNAPSSNNQNKPSPETDTENNKNDIDEDEEKNEDKEGTEENEDETGKTSDGAIKLPIDWFD